MNIAEVINITVTERRMAGTITQILAVILLGAASGCGMPQPIGGPIPRPIPMPIPQPIGQPVPQPIGLPISQPTPQPIGQPISQPTTNVFSIAGTSEQQATIRSALARCSFPFERLKLGLQRSGRNSIRVFWEPMSDGSLGWASTNAEVAIKDDLRGLQAQRTAILEIGHAVDFFYLTPDMRKEIIRLWHPDIADDHQWFDSTKYWDRNGEAYSALFLWAFTDEEMWFDAGYSHKPSKELAMRLRAIMLPAVATRSQTFSQSFPGADSTLYYLHPVHRQLNSPVIVSGLPNSQSAIPLNYPGMWQAGHIPGRIQ